MPKLKLYTKVQIEKGAVPPKPKVKSGVACTDFMVEEGLVDKKYRDKKGKIKFRKVKGMVKTKKPCSGEMIIFDPVQKHPEYPQLQRASCNKCGWRGWV